MTNRALMNLLKQLNPDDEICVEIKECITDQFVDSTYDIGYKQNEYGQLVLVVDIEKGKFDSKKTKAYIIFYKKSRKVVRIYVKML